MVVSSNQTSSSIDSWVDAVYFCARSTDNILLLGPTTALAYFPAKREPDYLVS